MLLMNFTEEENLARVALLIDTDFARHLFVAMFEQVSSITVETAEKCMKSVQSTAINKISRISLTSSAGTGKYMNR